MRNLLPITTVQNSMATSVEIGHILCNMKNRFPESHLVHIQSLTLLPSSSLPPNLHLTTTGPLHSNRRKMPADNGPRKEIWPGKLTSRLCIMQIRQTAIHYCLIDLQRYGINNLLLRALHRHRHSEKLRCVLVFRWRLLSSGSP